MSGFITSHDVLSCDPGRHLQECSGEPGPPVKHIPPPFPAHALPAPVCPSPPPPPQNPPFYFQAKGPSPLSPWTPPPFSNPPKQKKHNYIFIQDDGKRVEFKGSLHDGVGGFSRFWKAPCLPFACPTKYSTMRQPWRFWRFWRFRRLWWFRSWRLPP